MTINTPVTARNIPARRAPLDSSGAPMNSLQERLAREQALLRLAALQKPLSLRKLLRAETFSAALWAEAEDDR